MLLLIILGAVAVYALGMLIAYRVAWSLSDDDVDEDFCMAIACWWPFAALLTGLFSVCCGVAIGIGWVLNRLTISKRLYKFTHPEKKEWVE